MKKLLGKAVVIALAAVIVGGATVAFAAGGFWNGNGFQGGQNGYGPQGYGQDNFPQGNGLGNGQFAPGEPVPGGQGQGKPGMLRRMPGIKVPGTISSIDDNTVVVDTRKGQIKVVLDGKVRIIEIRTSLEPVGLKEGQKVILDGRMTKDGPKVFAIIVPTGAPVNQNIEEPADGAAPLDAAPDGAIGF